MTRGFRADISDSLIHFTKGENDEDAFIRLLNIIIDSKLTAGNGNIRGGYNCICFTETPMTHLDFGLVNDSGYAPYSPFGIKFDKQWLFENGARPVIYQPDSEYDILPGNLRWRHVRYEPGSYDFTWEREWRLHADELIFTPESAEIVVPSIEWKMRIFEHHEHKEEINLEWITQALDRNLAEQYRYDFTWQIHVLNCNGY